MKSRLLITLFVLALIYGCSDQTESDDSRSLISNTEMNGPNKPFKVRGSGTFVGVAPDGSCNLPVQIALNGGGNATHTGLYTVDLTWCFQPPEGPLFIFGTIIAANGDELYIETTGQGVGDNGEVYETFAFVGGTGRFTEVSGEFDLYTTTVWDTNCDLCGTYTNYGEGTISY